MMFLQYIRLKILFIMIIEFGGVPPQFGVPGACLTGLTLALAANQATGDL